MQIITQRLFLVQPTIKFIPEIFANFNDEIHEFLTPPLPTHISETETAVELFMQQWIDCTNHTFVITDKFSGDFIGLCGIHNLKDRPCIGIWLKKSAHGKKLGIETVAGLLEHARSLQLYDILYKADVKNIPSIKTALHFNGQLVEKNEILETKDGRTLHLDTYKIRL